MTGNITLKKTKEHNSQYSFTSQFQILYYVYILI